VAESDGLENRCTRLGTVGSNPTPSAFDGFARHPGLARWSDGVARSISPCSSRRQGPISRCRRNARSKVAGADICVASEGMADFTGAGLAREICQTEASSSSASDSVTFDGGGRLVAFPLGSDALFGQDDRIGCRPVQARRLLLSASRRREPCQSSRFVGPLPPRQPRTSTGVRANTKALTHERSAGVVD
jgi:hypothetical protein